MICTRYTYTDVFKVHVHVIMKTWEWGLGMRQTSPTYLSQNQYPECIIFRLQGGRERGGEREERERGRERGRGEGMEHPGSDAIAQKLCTITLPYQIWESVSDTSIEESHSSTVQLDQGDKHMDTFSVMSVHVYGKGHQLRKFLT